MVDGLELRGTGDMASGAYSQSDTHRAREGAAHASNTYTAYWTDGQRRHSQRTRGRRRIGNGRERENI